MQNHFNDIIDKLNANELWDFPGGIHPEQHKSLSNQQPIATLPIPERLFVPLKQHIGVEGHVCVKAGQTVLKGQPLTKSMNPFAVPVHAPTSGTVVRISEHVSAHPSGLPEVSVEIATDQQDTWAELHPLPDYQKLPKMKVLEAICDSGISGMGGAGFPTHIKASPKKDVEFLIINGIECEPYITSDDRLMREHAWQIRQGIDVLTHLLKPQMVLIGIEDNKPEAIEAMTIACRENALYRICTVPTKYPAGGEKQLIQVLTNREVPSGGLPMDVGVIMQNVGTCFAIADAIFSGKPLIQRVVTVTGQAVNKRQNYWTLIGTPIEHLLAHNEYLSSKQKAPSVIMGGPMMGFTVASPLVPVVKITNCILVPSDKELAGALSGQREQACIRCGACADACPASLLPQQLLWHAKAKELDKAQDYHLFDCIECGACAYVCPSEIPLVHYYRIAKAEVRIEQQEKQKADKARERFETRAARLLADQQAREEKHRLAAEARKQAMEQSGNDAKDKIAAALARAKEKKHLLQQQTESDETASPKTDAATQPLSSDTQQTAEISQNERVQAAIARAKAKKANAGSAENQADSTSDKEVSPDVNPRAADEVPSAVSLAVKASHNERVQAAIARAKSKKAAAGQIPADPATSAPPTASEALNSVDKVAKTEKKSRSRSDAPTEKIARATKATVSAEEPANPAENKQRQISRAVAKAKAKKQATLQDSEPAKSSAPQTDKAVTDWPALADNVLSESAKADTQSSHAVAAPVTDSPMVTSPSSSDDDVSGQEQQKIDDKKRRIAAAVAKAKAKKAAEQAAKPEKD